MAEPVFSTKTNSRGFVCVEDNARVDIRVGLEAPELEVEVEVSRAEPDGWFEVSIDGQDLPLGHSVTLDVRDGESIPLHVRAKEAGPFQPAHGRVYWGAAVLLRRKLRDGEHIERRHTLVGQFDADGLGAFQVDQVRVTPRSVVPGGTALLEWRVIWHRPDELLLTGDGRWPTCVVKGEGADKVVPREEQEERQYRLQARGLTWLRCHVDVAEHAAPGTYTLVPHTPTQRRLTGPEGERWHTEWHTASPEAKLRVEVRS